MFGRQHKPIQITPGEAVAGVQQGTLTLVDVREVGERRTIAPGVPSTHVPLATLAARLADLPAQRPVAFVCQAGGRSAKAAAAAQRAGLDARNVTGGMLAWDAAGLPVKTGASA